jgi:hypothetical protein
VGLLERGRANLAAYLTGQPPTQRDTGYGLSLDDWASIFTYGGVGYPLIQTTMGSIDRERIFTTAIGAHHNNVAIFALVAARVQAFSQVRFQWTRFSGSQPGDLFGTDELKVLEHPWPGGRTSDLLARMEVDNSIAGNAYIVRPRKNRLARLRPDLVVIVLGSQMDADYPADAPDVEVAGYLYYPRSGHPMWFLPEQVAHYAPLPDPTFQFLGMSWITAAFREVEGDQLMTEHKVKFLTNGATPNLAIKFDSSIPIEHVKQFKELFESDHKGVWNAYKTLFLGGGADPVPIGKDFAQITFAETQGKAEPLALTTPVPTPDGWTTMGDVAEGDMVLGRDGRPARVVATGPVHAGRRCYRLSLRNGETIVADSGHTWAAVDRGSASRKEKTYTTEQLYELHHRPYPNGAGGYRVSLPAAPVLELPERDLLIDPYVLGAWLGDGQTSGAAICGAWDDLKYIADEIEQRGYTTTLWPSSRLTNRSHEAGRAAVIGVPGGLLAALDALGVLGAKHLPGAYLRASAAQRLDLLRGLMDTDGTVDSLGRGQCAFSSKDEVLARQVLELIRSLGYRATLSRVEEVRSRTGETWNIKFRSRLDCVPFLLPRKVDRCERAGDPHYSDRRSIVSIEPVESVPVRCITVDTPDHLFLAGDGFVPTHNSRLAAAAGVPPSWVGFSEGLQGSSLNAGNFQSARRRFSDGTLQHLWTNGSGALGNVLNPPPGADLWFDARVPFMREDAGDIATIQVQESTIIANLVREGFTAESVVRAVRNNDWTLLRHSGLVSVQLNPPGSGAVPDGPGGSVPGPATAGQPANPAAAASNGASAS